MKPILLTNAFIAIFCSSALGQFYYPTKDEANLVLKKTLAIELLEGDNNQFLNDVLIQMFEENWTLCPFEFFSSEAIRQKFDNKDENYTYLFQEHALSQHIRKRKSYIYKNGLRSFNPSDKGYSYVSFSFEYYPFKLKAIKDGEVIPITNVTFANPELAKIDYIFLIQQLDRLISYSSQGRSSQEYYGDIEKNIERIKSNKLLVLSDFFKEKDLKRISYFHSFPYEVVDFTNHESAIVNFDKGTHYLKIIWNDFLGVYMWIVVDSETGKILAQTSFGGVQFGRHHTANDMIKARHLKYMVHKIAQKFNSRNYR